MIQSVIYDFHGTLADVQLILPLVYEGKYAEFYEASLTCPSNESVVLAARHSQKTGCANLLLTGMPEQYRDGLLQWLDRYQVPIDLLLMRMPDDGYQKDYVVKKRMYSDLLDRGYRAVRAWDDSPAVLDLWKAQGIPTVAIPRVNIPHVGSVDVRTAGSVD